MISFCPLRLVVAGCALLASPLAAQRTVTLTGAPVATLREPFTRISGLRELASGQVIVTDPMERALVVGDFTNGTRRSIGRQGEGPNEYRFLGAPFAGPGDTTWIPDAVLNRIHLVLPGGITGSLRLPASLAGFSAMGGVDRQGRIYFQGSKYDPDTGGFPDSIRIIRWTPKTDATETLTRVSSGGRMILHGPEGLSSIDRSMAPYPSLDAWLPLPDGRVALIGQKPYRIDWVDAPGHIMRGTAMTAPVIPVTARECGAFRDQIASVKLGASARGGGTSGPAMPAMQFADTDFPAALPPFRHDAVLVTPEGEIWIGRSAAAGAGTVTYDIHDGTGRLVGHATLKAHSSVVGFGKGTVYVARITPEDDLIYLEKYRR